MSQNDFHPLKPMKEHADYLEEYGIKMSNHTDKTIELSKFKGVYN